MDLEVTDLRLVTAVAATGSLVRASDELFVTPSALSHRLRRLEDRLGTRLFTRGIRGMRPTAAGERLCGSARSLLAQLADAEHAVRVGARGEKPLLRLAVECCTCHDMLGRALRSLKERNPAVQIRIESGLAQPAMRRLEAGELDVAVVISTMTAEPALIARPLCVDELVVVSPADHRVSVSPFVSPADLAHENIFTWISPEESVPPLASFLARRGGVAAPQPAVLPPEAAVALVRAQLGLAVLPRRTASAYMTDGRLRAIPMGPRGLEQKWSVVISRRAAPAAHVQDFVRRLAQHARQLGVADSPALCEREPA